MKFEDLNLLSIGNTIQLVGAVYAGEGQTICVMVPGEELPMGEIREIEFPAVDELKMSHAEWKKFLRQTDILEVEALVEDPENKGYAKAIIRKTGRQIDQNTSWKVYRRDGFMCRYCGRQGGEIPLTVDHLVTWEDGGPSTEENLVAACKKCNKTRGNMPYAKWLNDPYYKRVSRGLIMKAVEDNLALVQKLDRIERRPHKRSR
jgi:hypothetical protein